jgi:8-oxo-dGTP pyrophosphatase MutT (NUDIX family)
MVSLHLKEIFWKICNVLFINKMKVENVKMVIKDSDGLFLVGLSSYPSPNDTYSLLGGHSEKGETPFETLGREMLEETSMIFNLNYDEKNGRFYMEDFNHDRFNFVFDGISIHYKQWYMFFNLDRPLTPYIEKWQHKFRNNQIKIKKDAVEGLKEMDSHLDWFQIIELFLKRKFIECKSELSKRLTKSEIQQVVSYCKDIGYYLENKNLLLVTLKDLKEKIYEKDVLIYL